MTFAMFKQESGARCAINPDHVVAVEESDSEGIAIIVTVADSVFSNYRVQTDFETAVVTLLGAE